MRNRPFGGNVVLTLLLRVHAPPYMWVGNRIMCD
jgi:hypothetical protein